MKLSIYSLVVFSLSFLSGHASANCEAGGYTIHTVAEYNTPSAKQSFLAYKADGQMIRARLSALELESASAVAGPFDLKLGAEKCKIPGGLELNPKYSESSRHDGEYPLQLNTGACAKLIAKAAPNGYLELDRVNKQIRLPTALKFQISSAADLKFKDLVKQVEGDARTRQHFLYTGLGLPPLSEKNYPLKSADIDGVRTEITTVGEAASAFVMAIAVLRIKNFSIAGDKAFADPWWKGLLASSKLGEGKPEFPVIYFQSPGSSKPKFVGDGSACSFNKYQAYEKPTHGAAGSFDRFKITAALDLTADGKVDILEINDSFVYRLLPDGKPEVIDYGQGC